MTPAELLGLARDGDLEALGEHRGAVADAVRAFAQAGDASSALELCGRAAGIRLQHDYSAARELYLESLNLNAELGNAASVAMELDCLGWVELHLGDIDSAAARFHERDARAGTDPYGVAWSNVTWAAVAIARGDRDEAERRFVAGTSAFAKLGAELDPDDQAELDWVRGQLARPGD